MKPKIKLRMADLASLGFIGLSISKGELIACCDIPYSKGSERRIWYCIVGIER